uniref:Large ribosomal subunit protein uL13c n=1 Tax=Lophocladia kuetzingii TaxID=675577 RepID=A0A1Z1MPE0_9FLOR|nr:ribosomal protein L13 [Lophocladia kuetzingii]ARW67719.1 ribosomal protein L13 [Lophocladia kuetzingii]
MDKNKTIIQDIPKEQQWYLIDAQNQNLGRLSSQIATTILGKNKIQFLPYQENNVHIIIINSKDIKVTGNKDKQKTYKRHSGRPGGLKIEKFNEVQKRIPNKILEHSIKGMLPKNTLGRNLYKKINIYSNNEYPSYMSKNIKTLNIN